MSTITHYSKSLIAYHTLSDQRYRLTFRCVATRSDGSESVFKRYVTYERGVQVDTKVERVS